MNTKERLLSRTMKEVILTWCDEHQYDCYGATIPIECQWDDEDFDTFENLSAFIRWAKHQDDMFNVEREGY
jgi:hypothetical protein